MILRCLSLAVLVTACGPIHSEKKDDPDSGKHSREPATTVIAARTGGGKGDLQEPQKTVKKPEKISGKKQGVPKPPEKPVKTKNTPKKTKSPKKGPHQNPSQTPFQGVIQDPDAPTLEILGLTYEGGGCPADSIAENISPDGEAFTLILADYLLSFDPEGESVLSTECRIDIDMKIPSGYRFSIVSVDYRGFAALSEGDHGEIETRFGFAGGTETEVTSVVDGPLFDDYVVSETFGASTRSWYGCGDEQGRLEIDFASSLHNTSGEPNEMTVDSVDGELTQKFALVWEACED